MILSQLQIGIWASAEELVAATHWPKLISIYHTLVVFVLTLLGISGDSVAITRNHGSETDDEQTVSRINGRSS